MASNYDAVHYPDYPVGQEIVIVSTKKMPPVEWIRASEAAEIMNVSISNVYYLCREGKIECRKWGNTWQVSKADAENYKRSNRNPDWLHPNDES
jgi:excisionase family DNA binding protein